MMYDFISMANKKKEEKEKEKRLSSSRNNFLNNKSMKLFSMQVMIAMIVMVLMVLVVPSKGDDEQHYCLQTNIDPNHFKTEAPIEAQVEMIRMIAAFKRITDKDIAMISAAARMKLDLTGRDDKGQVIPIDLQSDEWFGIASDPDAGFQDWKAWLSIIRDTLGPNFRDGKLDQSVSAYCAAVRYRKALRGMVAQFPIVHKWFTNRADTRQLRLKAFFRVFVRLISFKQQDLLDVAVLTAFLQQVRLWQELCGGGGGDPSGQSSGVSSSEAMCTSLLTKEVTAQRRRPLPPPDTIALPIWSQLIDSDMIEQSQSSVVIEKLNQMLVGDLHNVNDKPDEYKDKGAKEMLAFNYRVLLVSLWFTIKAEANKSNRVNRPTVTPSPLEQTKPVQVTTAEVQTTESLPSKRKCPGNKCVWALGSLGVVGAVGGGAYYGYPYVKTWIDYMFGVGKSTTPMPPAIQPNDTKTNNTEVTSSSGQSSVFWIVPIVVVIALLMLTAFVAYYYYGLFGGGKGGSDSNKSSHVNKLAKHTGKAITTNTSTMKNTSNKTKIVKPTTVTPTTTTSSANVNTKKSQKKSLV